MTFRSHTLLDGLGKAVRYLSLALLPALVAEGGQANLSHRGPVVRPYEADGQSSHRSSNSVPYLAVIAPPSLRFRDAPAPPNFDLEPVAAGPAEMDSLPEALPSAPRAQLAAAPQDPESLAKALLAKKEPAGQQEENRMEANTPPAILPDDLRREVRPEDLLPFFQFPRGGPTMGPGVPVLVQPAAPAPPPSSATYRLQ